MKLIPAPGSKEMQYALEHHYVQKIVDILLQEIDLDFFKVVAMFLRKYDRPSLPGFVDRPSRYESDQVDIAVLSEVRQQIEGYACKIKPAGIMSVDCTNLTALAVRAQDMGYDVHTGVVCFDNSNVITQRIKKFPLMMPIKAYGLDNIQDLRTSPFQTK